MTLRNKKSFIAGLITFVLIFSLCFAFLGRPAEAVSKAELDALKQQQAALDGQKEELQKQADAISGQLNAQTERLELLSDQVELTNSVLENLSDQIAVYMNSIAEKENELNANELKERQLLARYRMRIRAMEEAGSVSYISVLFQADSFGDLLSRLDTIREIMAYDNGLIQEVQAAGERVAVAKADMETAMAEQQEVFALYQEKERDLAAQQEEVNAILESLSADSADYQEQLKSIKTLQSSISAQITDMQHQLAEQERIRAEQAAAAKAAAEKAAAEKNSKWYNDAEGSGTGTGQDIVDYAKTFLGVPYVYGGTSPKGFDCSGLVYYCYKHYGYPLNRTASGQALNGKAVSSSELKAGDIIIFSNRSGKQIGHCGIYVGNGKFIHAPHTGDVVKISSLSDTYYKNHYWSARRIIN